MPNNIHILKNLTHPQIIQLLDVICPYLDNKHMNQFLTSNIDTDLLDDNNDENNIKTVKERNGENYHFLDLSQYLHYYDM